MSKNPLDPNPPVRVRPWWEEERKEIDRISKPTPVPSVPNWPEFLRYQNLLHPANPPLAPGPWPPLEPRWSDPPDRPPQYWPYPGDFGLPARVDAPTNEDVPSKTRSNPNAVALTAKAVRLAQVAAPRSRDKGVFATSDAPRPEARYLVRAPNDAYRGSVPMLPSNAAPPVAPPSFDDRFGNSPSSPQATVPPPGAGYPARLPSPQTSTPALPDQLGSSQQLSPWPEERRPLAFPVPPMVYGLPDPSVAAGDNMDDWFDRWIKPLMQQ